MTLVKINTKHYLKLLVSFVSLKTKPDRAHMQVIDSDFKVCREVAKCRLEGRKEIALHHFLRRNFDAEVGGQLSSLFPACSSFGCKCSFNSALNCEKMAPYIHRTFGNEVQLLTNPRLKKVV